AVQREDIFTTTTDANALYVMQTMGKNSYTHVPVLEGDAMVGVFSENTVFSYLVKNQILALDQDILIGEFAEFIPLDKHESEYFEFVPREDCSPGSVSYLRTAGALLAGLNGFT